MGIDTRRARDRAARDSGSPTAATGLIFGAVVLAATGVYAAVTMAPVIARDLTGSAFLAGLPIAALLAGAGGGAAAMAAVIRRYGRRAALVASYTVGAAASALTVVAVASGSFVLLLAGLLGVGVGHGANQLARYTAAELHAPARQPSVIGWIVWAQAIGAALGPLLLGPSGRLAELVDGPGEAGAFVLGVALFALAAGVHLLRGHRGAVAATGVPPGAPPRSRPAPRRSPWARPAVRVALAALVTSQVVMLLVMTMTPVHAHGSGHGLAAVGAVMSAHTLGMFALSPLAGRLAGRFGSVAVIGAGLALLGVGAAWAAVSTSQVALAGALFLLGLGWSLGFVAGSALLTQALEPEIRPTVQARVEAITWIAGALASVASGLLLGLLGYALLCLFGALLLALPLAVIGTQRHALAGGAAGP